MRTTLLLLALALRGAAAVALHFGPSGDLQGDQDQQPFQADFLAPESFIEEVNARNSDTHSSSSTGHAHLVSKKARNDIQSLIDRWKFAGVSIAVVKASENISAYTGQEAADPTDMGNADKSKGWQSETLGFGIATEDGAPVDGKTLFAIASNSKLFTALSISLLIEDGARIPNGEKLDWHTKAKDIIPDDWQLSDPYASEHVDLTDLLSMRGGMPRHDLAHGPLEPVEIVRNLRNLKTRTEIRQYWQYNNMYYVTLSYIVEKLSGKRYIDFVRERILDPLGMDGTTYNATVARATGKLSDGFSHVNLNMTKCKETWTGLDNVPDSCTGNRSSIGWWTRTDGVFEAGAGGVITNAEELVKWLTELLDPKVLPKHAVDRVGSGIMAISNTKYPEMSPAIYGMGQGTMTYRGERVVTHTGGLQGQLSRIYRVPDRGIGVAVLTNDDYIQAFDLVSWRILDDLLGLDPIDWESRFAMEFIEMGAAQESGLPRPSNSTPPPQGFDNIPGIYNSPGYSGDKEVVSAADFFQPGEHQKLVESNWRRDRGADVPAFVVKLDHLFASYVLLEHFNDTIFNVSMVWNGNGVHPVSVSQTAPNAIAVVVPDGIGLWAGGIAAGYDPSVPIVPLDLERLEETAEIYFKKVA